MNTNESKIHIEGCECMSSVIITLRVNEELKKELDRMALEENRSLNNFISTILMKYVDEKQKEQENKK